MPRCPICRKSVAAKAQNPAFPFCSERCRLMDLGKWLGEEYRVPVKAEETEDAVPELKRPGNGKGDDTDGDSS